MATLHLTHSHAAGTLLTGTTRGDSSAAVLKARPGWAYWKWSRNIGAGGAWYIPHSRDKPAQRSQLDATAAALHAAGFAVVLDVDDTPRATAEVVAGQRERSADRAEALHRKADRQLAAADAHHERVEQITSNRPLGQPILVGHHSEARARRDQARIEQGMDAWVVGQAEARETERRAQAAAHNATGRESRTTVANRAKKLRADVARDLRALHGYWNRWGQLRTWNEAGTQLERHPVDPDSAYGRELCERIAHTTERRLYWAEVLADMPASPEPVKPAKGDAVEVDGAWLSVVRSSKHDVTVSWPSADDPKGTRRVPWSRISGWNRAAAQAAS